MPLLGKIEAPIDRTEYNLQQLVSLCAELRQTIIETVARNGGHLSSNLGVVELTVALHTVFASPADKIIWDVGHQSYAHKLLTGRAGSFSSLRKSGGISGFPRRNESPHDAFNTGHASTSISIALGFLAAEIRNGGNGLAVAVIGDGALTGGLAYEALSNAGHMELPLIIILNDNNMSISPNVGALSRYLSRLSMKGKYQTFRRKFDGAVRKIPLVGASLFRLVNRLKRAVKAAFYQENFFVDLGFEYAGPVDGHDLRALIDILHDVRKLQRPVVLHVITQKGYGYRPAEDDPGAFHSVPPFSIVEGKLPQGGESWTRAFGMALLDAGRKNQAVVAITAAMEKGTGLSHFRAAFPERFFDAGIAEAHAVTFAAALSVCGLRPVVAVYSTFMQRAVDSIIHDAAINGARVIFAIDRAGFVPGDGETHQGLFDISILRAVPDMTILTPACGAELPLLLDWALACEGSCAIRYPKSVLPAEESAFTAPVEQGRGVFARKTGSATRCIAFTGSLWPEVQDAAMLLDNEGYAVDLYHLRFVKPIDEDYLLSLFNQYAWFIIIEEAARNGGVGEYLISLAYRHNCGTRIISLAAEDRFYPHGTREELLRQAGLDGASIASQLLAQWAHENVLAGAGEA